MSYTQLENDDLFCVTRGFEENTRIASSIFGDIFGEPSTSSPEPENPRYSRDYEGFVFRARVVAGPMVAAEIVSIPSYSHWAQIGRVISLNLTEIEVMPVPVSYLAAIQSKPEVTP